MSRSTHRSASGPLEQRVTDLFAARLSVTPRRAAELLDHEPVRIGGVLQRMFRRGQVNKVRDGRDAHYFMSGAQRAWAVFTPGVGR